MRMWFRIKDWKVNKLNLSPCLHAKRTARTMRMWSIEPKTTLTSGNSSVRKTD